MICDIEKCTGCGLCANICPVNAVVMQETINDFIYPVINSELCINCHLCEKNCPANSDCLDANSSPDVYAAWNKNKVVRRNSSSGGVFTVFSEYVLEMGGVVVGVRWSDSMEAEHCIIDKPEELYKLQGSKYVQSNTNDIYKRVQSILDNGRYVLFSGTPCQNHALKRFLRKEYSNLYMIDIVCHGVPSQKMLDRHLAEIDTQSSKINDIRFRFKDPYWDYSFVKIVYDDHAYKELTIDDNYFNLFNMGFSIRESCHNCKYTSTNRYGDITLADFWGYRATSSKMRDFQKGVSLLLVNNEKGKGFLDKIKDKLVIEDASISRAVRGNNCLSQPFKVPEAQKEEFWIDYNKGCSVEDLEKKYVGHPYELPRLLTLRRIAKKILLVKKSDE